MNLISSAIDLLFPPVCFSCLKRISNEEKVICASCLPSLYLPENTCPVCGNYLKQDTCEHCRVQKFHFNKAFSLFPFNKVVQSLIHNMKYNEFLKISIFLRPYLQDFCNNFISNINIDIVAPVPLHFVKRRARGFNQAELISRIIAELMNLKHLPYLIRRRKFTQTQTHLTKSERYDNVNSAFCLRKKYDIIGKNILLVDDVFTTGATVNNISKLLKDSAAGSVYILTIAHA